MRRTSTVLASLALLSSPALAGRVAESQDVVEHGLALARRRGDRVWERSLMTNLISGYFALGQWDEAAAVAAGEGFEALAGRHAGAGVEGRAEVVGEGGCIGEDDVVVAATVHLEQAERRARNYFDRAAETACVFLRDQLNRECRPATACSGPGPRLSSRHPGRSQRCAAPANDAGR